MPLISSGARTSQSAFFAEMALSPVLAGIALLVPLAEHWGAYGYVPAILWLAIFVQCLFSFQWRGFWFLLGPPLAFVGIEAFLLAAPPVANREASTSSAIERRLITRNPDGTITVQKQPPKGTPKGSRESGLIIPPQVVAPTISGPPNK
jgi:hypothetical protein